MKNVVMEKGWGKETPKFFLADLFKHGRIGVGLRRVSFYMGDNFVV